MDLFFEEDKFINFSLINNNQLVYPRHIINNKLFLPIDPETGLDDNNQLLTKLKYGDILMQENFPVLSLTTNRENKFYRISIERLKNFARGLEKQDKIINLAISHLFILVNLLGDEQYKSLLLSCIKKTQKKRFIYNHIEVSLVPTLKYSHQAFIPTYIFETIRFYGNFSLVFFEEEYEINTNICHLPTHFEEEMDIINGNSMNEIETKFINNNQWEMAEEDEKSLILNVKNSFVINSFNELNTKSIFFSKTFNTHTNNNITLNKFKNIFVFQSVILSVIWKNYLKICFTSHFSKFSNVLSLFKLINFYPKTTDHKYNPTYNLYNKNCVYCIFTFIGKSKKTKIFFNKKIKSVQIGKIYIFPCNSNLYIRSKSMKLLVNYIQYNPCVYDYVYNNKDFYLPVKYLKAIRSPAMASIINNIYLSMQDIIYERQMLSSIIKSTVYASVKFEQPLTIIPNNHKSILKFNKVTYTTNGNNYYFQIAQPSFLNIWEKNLILALVKQDFYYNGIFFKYMNSDNTINITNKMYSKSNINFDNIKEEFFIAQNNTQLISNLNTHSKLIFNVHNNNKIIPMSNHFTTNQNKMCFSLVINTLIDNTPQITIKPEDFFQTESTDTPSLKKYYVKINKNVTKLINIPYKWITINDN